MKLRKVLAGIKTFIPGVGLHHAKGTGGTISARYCYSVWLRHLIMAKESGLNPYPQAVAELGPGDSLGIGLAALISGSEKYFAFDVVEHASLENNIVIFDELVTLFKSKAPIPGNDEWPNVEPRLKNYGFPEDIFDDARLKQMLEDSRIEKIRDSIKDSCREDSMIQYRVPWYSADVLETGTVDMIYSQAVLEHVDDLQNTYAAMYSWLNVNGFMTHTIDYKCHGTANEWNGHWTYSDLIWKLIRGRRPFLLNRAPHSTHIAIMNEKGFKIVCDKKTISDSKLTSSQLAQRFQFLSSDDQMTSAAFVIGLKNGH